MAPPNPAFPDRTASAFLRQMPLIAVAMPIPAVRFRMQLVWHERTDRDAGAQFFRALILEAVRTRQRK
jgi:DNA-binding transcriptional LysR family regulator